jgi:glutamate racemase
VAPNSRSIGIFDSGIGGLTVLRALRHSLPHESFLYLGDTARLPYGTKTPDTIQRYARQAAALLLSQNVKAIVVACNTASAAALDDLRCLPVPVVGVVEPGAAAACRASRSGRIAVLSTEATARSRAYEAAIRAINPSAIVTPIPCPLLVSFAEEGWTEGPVPEAVVRRYLEPHLHRADSPDCFVLGCTHFPLLKHAVQNVVGPWPLIDSGAAAAIDVDASLNHHNLHAPATAQSTTRFMVTDGPDRFARLAAMLFGAPVREDHVELVDLSERAESAVAPAA